MIWSLHFESWCSLQRSIAFDKAFLVVISVKMLQSGALPMMRAFRSHRTHSRQPGWLCGVGADLRLTPVEEALLCLAGSSASLHLTNAGLSWHPLSLHLRYTLLPLPTGTSFLCSSSFCVRHRLFKLPCPHLTVMSWSYHWLLPLTQVHKSLCPNSQERNLGRPARHSEPDLAVIGHWPPCTGLSLGKMSGFAPTICDGSRGLEI